MTSANVTYYYIYRGEALILKTSQHHLCKNRIVDELRAIENPEECTLRTNWPDEHEAPNWTDHGNLAKYIDGINQRKQKRDRSNQIWMVARRQIERENPGIEVHDRVEKTQVRAEEISYAVGKDNYVENLKYFS